MYTLIDDHHGSRILSSTQLTWPTRMSPTESTPSWLVLDAGRRTHVNPQRVPREPRALTPLTRLFRANNSIHVREACHLDSRTLQGLHFRQEERYS